MTMGLLVRSLIVWKDVLGVCSSATMLAEYDVKRNSEDSVRTKTVILPAREVGVRWYPAIWVRC
jgi:hypothetical protein